MYYDENLSLLALIIVAIEAYSALKRYKLIVGIKQYRGG